MSKLEFLILVLQSSSRFDLISLFLKVLFSLILTVYEGHVQLMLLGSLCSTGFFLKGREQCFCSFYRPKSSTCFSVKTHVFERSFIFYTFVCKHGALHLRLQVLALSASVTMARPTNSSQKLNIYCLDLLDRIFLQL